MNEVERLLALAHGSDLSARRYRQQAGQALIRAREHGLPNWRGKLDEHTADLLINLAVGRE